MISSARSWNSMTFPESRNIVLRCKSATAGVRDCGPLIAGQFVNALPARFDFARNLGKLLLVLFGPGFDVPQHLFGALVHKANLARNSAHQNFSGLACFTCSSARTLARTWSG